jgi:uncharacterized membrane protein
MKILFNFIKTTLFGGFFFLLPMIVVLLLLQKALASVSKLLKPLVEWLQVKSVAGIEIPYLLSVLLLLLVCFLAGLIGKTEVGARTGEWLDRWLGQHLPGYRSEKEKAERLQRERAKTVQESRENPLN